MVAFITVFAAGLSENKVRWGSDRHPKGLVIMNGSLPNRDLLDRDSHLHPSGLFAPLGTFFKGSCANLCRKVLIRDALMPKFWTIPIPNCGPIPIPIPIPSYLRVIFRKAPTKVYCLYIFF